MTIEFSLAQKNLVRLIEEFSPLGPLSNEAQTRFSFVDQLLTECLGWPREAIKVEVYEDGERSDYECGIPRQMVVEAKHARKFFEFPPRGKNSNVKLKIKSLMAFNEPTRAAVEQVRQYCQSRGVPLAVISNGPQLVIFLASRLDGTSPLDGDALVFDSYESILGNFQTIFDSISRPGVDEKRCAALLDDNQGPTLPVKLSSLCLNYFSYKYSSSFQENVKNASSLVIEDVGRTSEFEHDFLKDCYCESGPLTQYSLLSKNILSTRYASLFSDSSPSSRIEEVNPKKRDAKFGAKVVAEALSRRPIVLLGDVGVGKTSFIKNLIQIEAKAQFDGGLIIYFDLGSQGALSATVRGALLNQLEKTLRTEYKINLQDSTLLEKIYEAELDDFDNGFIGNLRNTNPILFAQKRIEHIQSLMVDRAEHLRKALEEVSKSRKGQIIVIIDNADQRDILVQQEAFVIAHELASTWNALVFLSLRPQTFHASKRSGTISAYPPKVFVIAPPKLEDVIEKRLKFALKIAEGKLPISAAKDLSMHVESLAILIKALQTSLRNNSDLYEFIINVSSGNVRVAIELISKFLGNPNVDSERIVQIFSDQGTYNIPLHEFSKGGLLGDYAHYQEDASYAYNVFATAYSDKREHFLSLLILGYLAWSGAHRDHSDGFVGLSAVALEMQSSEFNEQQTNVHLQKLTRKKLIETTERRLLETDGEIANLGMPEAYRLTPLGAYHLKKWVYDFSYLEAMAFDTPIFDQAVRNVLAQRINESTLVARYERGVIFKRYLDDIWSSIQPTVFFDWNSIVGVGKISFDRVQKKLSDQGKL